MAKKCGCKGKGKICIILRAENKVVEYLGEY